MPLCQYCNLTSFEFRSCNGCGLLGKSSRMPFAGLCCMLPSLLSHQATTTDTIRIAHLCGCINFECRSYNSPPILVTIVCWVMAVSSFRNLVEPHHPVYGAPTPRPAVQRLAATGRVARGPSPLACNLLLAPSVAIARALGGCVPVTVARGQGMARHLPLPPPLPPPHAPPLGPDLDGNHGIHSAEPWFGQT